jgi:DNA-directed RNA polymerase subunit RPC12/RpoP
MFSTEGLFEPGQKYLASRPAFHYYLRQSLGHSKENPAVMICPACHAPACRRSRRRTFMDFAAALIGSLPWRCSRCGMRFRSRLSPVSSKLSAHCAICGNRDLKRIAPEHVTGFAAPFKRLLGMPAYRCIPCRHKFFSFRPLKEPQDDQLRIAS